MTQTLRKFAAALSLLAFALTASAQKVDLVDDVTSILLAPHGGTGVADFSFSGNTHKVASAEGSFTDDHCLKVHVISAGVYNFVDAGAACGSGGGGAGGDVSSNTSSASNGQVAVAAGNTGKLIGFSSATGRPHLLSGVLGVSLVDVGTEVTGRLPFANMVAATAANRVMCRGSAAGAGDWQECTIGAGMSMTGTELDSTGGGGAGVTDGDKGDISVSGSGGTWTIDNGVLSLVKMANIATASLIGRNTTGTGVPEVLAAATVRSLLGLVPDTDVQRWDTDLDQIRNLIPANDDFIQRKSGLWTSRTPAQVNTDLLALAPTMVTDTGTSRSLTSADNNKIIRFTSASPVTVTVPTAFSGYGVTIVRAGAGTVTLAASSTTLNGASLVLNGQYLAASIMPTGTANTFDIVGATGDVDAGEEIVASATTTQIGATASKNCSITGTTTITSLGTIGAGVKRWCRFTGALTFTHNATSLILPNNGSNITTAAGDRFMALSLGSGNWVVLNYTKANGQALVGSGSGLADGDYGDVTVSSSGAAIAVDSGAIFLAKMANLAQDQFIGRVTASTGVPETATITAAARTVLDDTTVGAMRTTMGVGTGDSPEFTCVNIGAATDTTVCRSAAGITTVEGVIQTRTIAAGTATLATSAISSGACATAVSPAATGTASTDVINWGFNGDPTAVTGYSAAATGMLTVIAYPTTNTANFKVCNNTGSSITPGAITLNWNVVR